MVLTNKSTLQDILNHEYKNFSKEKFNMFSKDVLIDLVMYLINTSTTFQSDLANTISTQVNNLNTELQTNVVSKFCDKVNTINDKLYSDLTNIITDQVTKISQQVSTDMDLKLAEIQVKYDNELNTIRSQLTNNITETTNPDKLTMETPKHALLITQSPTDTDDETSPFTEQTWTTVVKKTLQNKLTDIPVKKSTLTKSGKGYIEFPNKESMDKAQGVLGPSYNIEVSTKSKTMLYPKIKLCNIDSEKYTNDNKDVLHKAILTKNDWIRKMVNDDKLMFQ